MICANKTLPTASIFPLNLHFRCPRRVLRTITNTCPKMCTNFSSIHHYCRPRAVKGIQSASRPFWEWLSSQRLKFCDFGDCPWQAAVSCKCAKGLPSRPHLGILWSFWDTASWDRPLHIHPVPSCKTAWEINHRVVVGRGPGVLLGKCAPGPSSWEELWWISKMVFQTCSPWSSAGSPYLKV